jgi:hypothetical protein
VAALLAVFYLPFLQGAFDTQGLSAREWLTVAGLSLTPLVAGALAKISGLLQRWRLTP